MIIDFGVLLLQMFQCHASANFLIHHLIPDIVRLIPAQYCLNLLTNIFRYSTNLPSTNSPAIKCISVLLNSCVKSGTSNCNGANISINAAQNKGSNSVENCSMNDSAMILLDLLLDRYPISEFFALGLDLHTIAASKDLARPLALVDPIKCRIILASGFLTSSIRDARAARLWRQSHRYIAETCLCQNLCGLAIPHAFELITSNDKRLARKVLMDFLNQRSPVTNRESQYHLSKLEFLHDEREQDFVDINSTMFLLLTQPGLLPELLRSIDFSSYFEEKLSENPAKIAAFFIKLRLLFANLDTLVELRRSLNFPGRLTQV